MPMVILVVLGIACIAACIGGIVGFLIGRDKGRKEEADKWKKKGDWKKTQGESYR